MRTAQKWERERGLPVNRPGGKGPVTTTKEALDNWKNNPPTAPASHAYTWPLAHNITATITFTNTPNATHFETLRQYLALAKAAYERTP